MYCDYACGSPEHLVSRRHFLGGLTAAGLGVATGGLGVMASPVVAKQLASDQKRVLLFFLHGGVSQLETWDPKPGVATGGPFSAIKTSVPGLHISELLPYTAKQMHHLAVVRSVNSADNAHDRGAYKMVTGRPKTAAASDPVIGAVMARALGSGPSHLSQLLADGGSVEPIINANNNRSSYRAKGNRRTLYHHANHYRRQRRKAQCNHERCGNRCRRTKTGCAF